MLGKSILLVFIGGGLGASLRYGLGLATAMQIYGLKVSTLIANVLGSASVGFLIPMIKANTYSGFTKDFIIIGICGGLTTFSAYIIEAYLLLDKGEWRQSLFLIFFHHFLAFCVIYIAHRYSLYLLEK